MIKPEQIPDEAQQAGFDAWCKAMAAERDAISEAIAAAINAWPDMRAESRAVCDVIVLPIREPRDE